MEGIKQQISKLINKSNNILVAAPENINGDALGSALALVSALKKINKSARLLIPEEIPPKFQFLPKTNSLSHSYFQEREFVLTIKNPDGHINNLYYEKKDGLLHIYFKTKNKIKENDFRINHSLPFDLIFTINSQDYENLGKAFKHNSELFFETPVVNIDNHPANEHFGEINLIDITFSSVSEIVMELIDFIDRNLFDKEIATYILTGLIDATNNFQSPKISPRTFNNAAILINRGGDQQNIIRHFYKTKSLNLLQLWGRVLHKLFWDERNKLVIGKIKQEDFQKTKTSPEYLPQVLEEINRNLPEIETALLIWSNWSAKANKFNENKIKGIISSFNSELLKNLTYRLNGIQKNGNLFFTIKSSCLNEAEKQLLNLISQER